jgi:methylisocitrate lyase
MRKDLSPGVRFRQALVEESPLQIVGVINAYCALLAERQGYKALYLSGAGCANASHGMPDLGVTTLEDVLIDAKRITRASDLPLLVDIDTGWSDVGHTVEQMVAAGVAAVHIEDQVELKRCGHRPNKQCVSIEEMQARIRAGAAAKSDPGFVLMARTDAAAREGVAAAITRAKAYVEAGADAIFAEALTDLEQYKQFCQSVSVPVLANITEYGRTPLFTCDELAASDVAMALYPLTAFRAMSATAEHVYQVIRQTGTQESLVADMQTREELYDYLGYYQFEQQQDEELNP